MVERDYKSVLRDIVREAVDMGAACERTGSFLIAEHGVPVRTVYDVLTDKAVAALEQLPHLGAWQERKPG